MARSEKRSTRIDWYPVHTRANQEKDAETQLKRQGILTFLPVQRIRVRRKVPNRERYVVVDVERPYFSRYIFVGLQEGQSLYTVNNTPAVSTVVYNGDAPLAIPPAVMRRIMFLVDREGLVRIKKPERARPDGDFAGSVGDEVKILEGPFASFIGHIVSLTKYDRTGRLRVWLELFGRRTEVELRVEEVRLTGRKIA